MQDIGNMASNFYFLKFSDCAVLLNLWVTHPVLWFDWLCLVYEQTFNIVHKILGNIETWALQNVELRKIIDCMYINYSFLLLLLLILVENVAISCGQTVYNSNKSNFKGRKLH